MLACSLLAVLALRLKERKKKFHPVYVCKQKCDHFFFNLCSIFVLVWAKTCELLKISPLLWRHIIISSSLACCSALLVGGARQFIRIDAETELLEEEQRDFRIQKMHYLMGISVEALTHTSWKL